MERMRSPSIYLEEPLRELCVPSCRDGTFDDLPKPLLVNTVDLERGAPVIWGAPGLRDVDVQRRGVRVVRAAGLLPAGARRRPAVRRRRRDRQPAGRASPRSTPI